MLLTPILSNRINDILQLSSCSWDTCSGGNTNVQVAAATSHCTHALLPLGNSGGTMPLPLFCWDSQEGEVGTVGSLIAILYP